MNLIFQRFRSVFVLLTATLFLGACSGSILPDKLVLRPVNYGQLPGWESDKQLEAFAAFQKSCAVFLKRRPTSEYGPGDMAAPASIWQENCNIASQASVIDDASARVFFERYFVPFQVRNNLNSVGLFTGYYEPLLQGSRKRSQAYQVPVYGLPPDKQEGTPYYSREQINNGVLSARGLEIAWVNDPIELFFAEVQCSARVQLDTGEQIRIGFAGKNGQAYTPIGRVLIEEDILTKENVSMQSIKEWLRANPSRAKSVMESNQSFVFFRIVTEDGPIGAQSVALSPGRSLAVDLKFIPLGVPIYINTALTGTQTTSASLYRRLFIAQDTGGAIKGPVRGDIFFGAGPDAEWYAGHMKGSGEKYILLPHAIAQSFL